MGMVGLSLILPQAGECRAEQSNIPSVLDNRLCRKEGAEGWGDMGMVGGWGGRGKPLTWPPGQ